MRLIWTIAHPMLPAQTLTMGDSHVLVTTTLLAQEMSAHVSTKIINLSLEMSAHVSTKL